MKIILKLIRFFKSLTKKGRRKLIVEDINSKLAAELEAKTTNKIKTRRKIIKDFHNRKPGFSKYIPNKRKSNEKLKFEVLSKYGKEMNQVGLKITDDLKLK